ncbi:MAG: metal ABC transporter permease [Actinomycetota bacterium]|mgnify:FL=1|jgi:ABC-type Mn2+/Zn2+ transport system permease subunit|nr:metal ABC transporter permease [Actinomycetota bacterium]MDA3020346.1 metal ABC transporter permease [Actinomycetota bacterium]
MIIAVDLLKPFSYEFFRNGLIIATLAGALCGLIGVFVVLRGMSYIGHGLSHAVFGGAALAAVLNLNYFIGAGFWGLASGLMIGRVSRKRIIGADAAIGVITTASFAMGLALQARFGQAKRSIDAVLFGNVLGVFTSDILAVAGVGILSAVVIVGLYRKLLFATFDPEVAGVSGVSVPAMEAVLMVLLSATILVTVRVIGVLLISALLVLPAVTARLMTNSFGRMLWLSPVLGAIFGGVGMYISWYADVPSGAVIILAGTLVFIAAYSAVGVRRRAQLAGINHH